MDFLLAVPHLSTCPKRVIRSRMKSMKFRVKNATMEKDNVPTWWPQGPSSEQQSASIKVAQMFQLSRNLGQKSRYSLISLRVKLPSIVVFKFTTTLTRFCTKICNRNLQSTTLPNRKNEGSIQYLTISPCVSVRMSRCWARGKFGEHERGVRVARGAAECNFSL